MARWPRLSVAGVPMHITQRGNNRQPTFLCSDDFARYRQLLLSASASAGCAVNAYALMTNHVHLLVTPQSATSVSRLMQRLGGAYVRYFNRRYLRTGTLWEGRFKSALIDSPAYYLACSRYIDLNPLRAGLVTQPAEYEWSSFAHLAFGATDFIMTRHAEYLALGSTDDERRRAYRSLCNDVRGQHACHAIRTATRGGSALGGAAFRQRMEETLRRRVTRLPHGGSRVSPAVESRHF